MMRRRAVLVRLGLAALVLALGIGSPSPSHADPSVWARARDPAVSSQTELIAKFDALRAKLDQRRGRGPEGAALASMYLKEARRLLEDGRAASSRDPGLRHRYGWVLYQLDEHAAALPVLESVARGNAPAPIRADALFMLAQCYTSAGRYAEQVRAYDAALELQPNPVRRSTILMNRSEAQMALGDLTSAIDGYRSALSILPGQLEMVLQGVLAWWSLAVALDRSGDLEEGLEHIRIARTYDRLDDRIFNPNVWTFVPSHDEHYFRALGHWQTARHAELAAARAEAYGRAMDAWNEYLTRAPANDPWVVVGRTRQKQCQLEREAFLKRAGAKAKPAAAKPTPKERAKPR
jgi:tetratricopeptide (TPR) repeat protein